MSDQNTDRRQFRTTPLITYPVLTSTRRRRSSFEWSTSPPRPGVNRTFSEPVSVSPEESRAAYLLQETLNRDSLQRIHLASINREQPRSPISPPTSPLFTLSPTTLPESRIEHQSNITVLDTPQDNHIPLPSTTLTSSSSQIPTIRSKENLPVKPNRKVSPSSPSIPEAVASLGESKSGKKLHWIDQLKNKVEGESDSSNSSGISIEIPIEFVPPPPPRTSSHGHRTSPIPIDRGQSEEVEVLRADVAGEVVDDEESRGRSTAREPLNYRFPGSAERSKSSSKDRRRITPTRSIHTSTLTTIPTLPSIKRVPIDTPIYPTGFNSTQRRQSTPNPINVTGEPIFPPSLLPRRISLAPPPPLPISPFLPTIKQFTNDESSQKASPVPVVGFDFPGRALTPESTQVLGSTRNPTPPLAAAFTTSSLTLNRPSSTGSMESMAQKEEREKKLSDFFMNQSRISRGRSSKRASEEREEEGGSGLDKSGKMEDK